MGYFVCLFPIVGDEYYFIEARDHCVGWSGASEDREQAQPFGHGISLCSGVFFFVVGLEEDDCLGLWSESVGLDDPSSLFVESFRVGFGSERVSVLEDNPAFFESVCDEVVFPSWYGDGEWLPRLLCVGG